MLLWSVQCVYSTGLQWTAIVAGTIDYDLRANSGMDSDAETLQPDEMYLMLQADMLNIKKQERALQSEIDEIQNKFLGILKTCGMESDFPVESKMAASSPSFLMKSSTRSLTNVTDLSTCSDEDFLFQQMLKVPLSICSFTDSDTTSSDGVARDNNATKTMLLDSNCNYVDSPMKVDKSNSDNESVPQLVFLPEFVPRLEVSDGSGSSVLGSSSTSGGYPKSNGDSSTSDNQLVPECYDLDQEFMSRLQYYSDFTIDRQRKIDGMDSKLSSGNVSAVKSDKNTSDDELLTRHVEGCEGNQFSVPVVTSRSPSPALSAKSGRSTRSGNRTSSSQGSRKSSKSNKSNPLAHSTMLDASFSSNESSKRRSRSRVSSRSSSLPRANSTMIDDEEPLRRTMQTCSDEDMNSIYTWSIHDGSNDVLEDSYFKAKRHAARKPPLPPRKTPDTSSSSSSRKPECRDHDIHVMLGEPCSVSAIEHATTYRDGFLCSDSFYDDDMLKMNTLPRSSTRMKLMDKSSGSSSMEARCASVPDMLSVLTPSQDFHNVPQSPETDSAESSPLQDRLSCPGQSSSSSGGIHVLSPPEVPAFPGNVTAASEMCTDDLMDSILTDSPNSVGSSGIFAPYNSPDATDKSCAGSRASYSPASDFHSMGSPCQLQAPPTSFVSVVSQVPAAPSAKPDPVFKVPKNNQPLRNLFKFKRSRCKTPDARTSTPKPLSVRSDPVSKRKLFPSSSSDKPEVRLMDKKAVIRKFKKFSDNFYKKDKSGKIQIQTLAQL